MFIHIAKKATFTDTLKTKYTNSIVFIQDSQEIWTHGTFYAIPDTYKTKITNLQTALAALQAIYSFTTISDGTHNASATATAKTITFTGTGATTVTVGEDGVSINTPVNTLATGTTNGTVKFNGVDVAVKGLGDAAYKATSYFDNKITTAQNAANTAQSTADAKVASVKAATNAGINIAGTATAPTIGLKLDTTTPGNVTLSTGANGLKASVTIPADKVQGVTSNDKVIALDSNSKLLSSTLGLTYDSTNKKIKLTGIGSAEIASIDATAFIKDGMISGAELVQIAEPEVTEEVPYIKLTFNSDGGNNVIRFSVKDLVDVYDGANLKLKAPTAASSYSAPATGDSVDTAIGKLTKGIEDAKVSGVTSFGGKTGAITLATANQANGSVNLAMTNNSLSASIVGLGSAAYTSSTAYATSAQGGKADTAVQTVRAANTGTYISVAAAKSGTTINLTPSLTVKDIATASSSAKGLAEASDVKTYVGDLFSWEEL